jgi:hypothetical protein
VINLRLNIKDGEDIERTLDKLFQASKEAAFESVRHGAHKVVRRAKEGIAKGPKTGRVYTHRFPSVFAGGPRRDEDARSTPHQASAQGEYPAADTGNLMRGIHDEHGVASEAAGRPEDTFGAEIIAEAEYAIALELKPPEKGGRPFLGRALLESAEEIVDDMEEAIQRAMERP